MNVRVAFVSVSCVMFLGCLRLIVVSCVLRGVVLVLVVCVCLFVCCLLVV